MKARRRPRADDPAFGACRRKLTLSRRAELKSGRPARRQRAQIANRDKARPHAINQIIILWRFARAMDMSSGNV
jgi:hypothetical protein